MKYDVMIKVREYEGNDGRTKFHRVKVGTLSIKDGKPHWLMLEPHINLAAGLKDNGTLWADIFEQRQEGDRKPPPQRQHARADEPLDDDDVPF